MSSYFMVNIYINQPEKRKYYDEYLEKVKPIVESYGGEYLIRTEELTASSQEWKPDRIIVIRFPDRKHLDDCFSSKEYCQIKDLRISSVESRVIIVDGV